MSEQEQAAAGTAIAPRIAGPAELMLSDDEIRRTYRVAEALAQSGMWKDVRTAAAAFAKMVIGRDLGLSPAQAMQGIHIVEGGVQMHYAMLGQFVRSRDGYDYRAGWIKTEAVLDVGTADPATGEVRPTLPPRTFVWHDEEDPLDEREIVGAVVVFTVDGEQRGVSRFTIGDAQQAGLIKPDKPRAAWNAAPRNMLLARAMSNGIKWFVPEVLAGMPVYVEGEIPERKSLTAPVGNGGDEGTGVDLGPDVEKIIARAEELGHRGLSNRGALELALGSRAPGPVREWVAKAKAELDRFAKEQANPAAAADPPEEPVEEPVEEVDAVPVGGSVEEDEFDAVAENAVDDAQARLDAHLAAEEDREEER
jgi:hypothetical protein